MSFQDLIYDFDKQVEQHIADTCERVRADTLGLDIRAGYTLWVSAEGIFVDAQNDRSLQYYGGFEYVEGEFRQAAGTRYVFYSACDSRVEKHVNRYLDKDDV